MTSRMRLFARIAWIGPIVIGTALLFVSLCSAREPRRTAVAADCWLTGTAIIAAGALLAFARKRRHGMHAGRAALDRVLHGPDAPSVVFQPIWTVDGELIGHEALTRFTGRFASPADAFAVAEGLDRAPDLDVLCLAAIGAAVPRDLAGTLFVNLSPTTLTRAHTAERALEELVRCSGLDPRRIVVELTEQMPIAPESLALLERLRARGFRFALDDTGSGNAGLAVLARVPLDVVKIDGALLGALADDRTRAIVAGILTMAGAIDARVVVEGVETADHVRQCRKLAVDCGMGQDLGLQGYFLGRPETACVSSLPEPSLSVAS